MQKARLATTPRTSVEDPHPGYGPKYDVSKRYEYRDVTPLSWGQQFHAQVFVSRPAMQLIAERGGVA